MVFVKIAMMVLYNKLKGGDMMEWEWDDHLDIGEGAYYSDEERRTLREPYPDELWEMEFEDIE